MEVYFEEVISTCYCGSSCAYVLYGLPIGARQISLTHDTTSYDHDTTNGNSTTISSCACTNYMES
jgi:hypothetical protein